MSDRKREQAQDQEPASFFDEDDQPIVVDGEGQPIVVDGEAPPAIKRGEVPAQLDEADEPFLYAAEERQYGRGAEDAEDMEAPRRGRRERNAEDAGYVEDARYREYPQDAEEWERGNIRETAPPKRSAPSPRAAPPASGSPPRTDEKVITIRLKPLMMILGGVVACALVLGLLYYTFGSGIRGAIGTRPSSPSVTQVPTATATPDLNSGIPAGTTAGPLILLNPGVVRQGASLNVMGTGFAPHSVISLVVKNPATNKPLTTISVQADKNGGFIGATLKVPTSLSSGSFVVEAHPSNSTQMAKAIGNVAGGAPQVKLGVQVGQPGNAVGFSAHGFSPGETINVYWNSLGGQPVATFQADTGGGVGQGSLQIPFGVVGTNTFLFVGDKSQSMTAAPLLLLSLYPTATLTNYAIRADNSETFNGKGFGPGERVFVFLNDTNSLPIAVIQSDAHGAFHKAGNFNVPFSLKGKQTLVFMGEQSRTMSTVKFTVLPYMPHAQASTYGGFPGTTVTFYAAGFARDEVVHVFVGGTHDAHGNMVSCFRTDGKGNAASVGSYLIPGDTQVGKLTFSLIGAKSGSTALATMTIDAPPVPVNVPSQPPFTCPLDTNP